MCLKFKWPIVSILLSSRKKIMFLKKKLINLGEEKTK